MTKNELIDILNDMEGNPEIKLWNGLVGDYADVDEEVFCDEFVKESESHIRNSIRNELMVENQNFDLTDEEDAYIERAVQHRLEVDEWDVPNHFVMEERFEEWYGKDRKAIVVLQPKLMGKTYSDRLGQVSY